MPNDSWTIGNRKAELYRRCLRGTIVGLLLFVFLGTVTAVWSNPLFIRMTPVGPWEFTATTVTALLAGVTAALWVPRCRLRTSGTGGIASCLGIACPTCNKVLMLVFGGPVLLAWFDPVRPYLAAAGVIVLGFAAVGAWRAFRKIQVPVTLAGAPSARLEGGNE